MISFFLNLLKLLRGYWHALRADEELRILLFILATLLASATVFYTTVEGWSPVDALYFSVMTMSTIGHDGFVPSSTISKLFTIMFLLLSIGVYIAVLAKVVKVTLAEKKELRVKKKQKKAEKKRAFSVQQLPHDETDSANKTKN